MGHLYRHALNKKLYKLYRVSPPKVLGSWHEAVPYKHDTELHPLRKSTSHKRQCEPYQFEIVCEI